MRPALTKSLIVLLMVCGSTLGVAGTSDITFGMGNDPTTGRLDRCGVSLIAVDGSLAFKGSITVHNLGPKGFAVSSKGVLVELVGKQITPLPLKHWWFKQPGKPATIRISPVIPADTYPFKLTGLEFNSGVDVLSGILAGNVIVIGVEPETGGAGNIRTTFTPTTETVNNMMNCLDELGR